MMKPKITKEPYSYEYREGVQYKLFLWNYTLLFEINLESIFIKLIEKCEEKQREVCSLSFRKPFLP